jgi:anti-sigma regulatory factor (Ser/Thr protein kinase)
MSTTTSSELHSNSIHAAGTHFALFYDDRDQYVEGVLRFVGPALEAGQPAAIAVPGSQAALVREFLDPAVDVEFFDMVELGRNPARIIPAVEGILARHEGRMLHYVGEPIWPGRSAEEIREVTKHEALINLAWPGAQIRVLCPYDAVALDDEVLADAERTHPQLIRHGIARTSPAYAGAELPLDCDEALADPPPDAVTIPFGLPSLYAVRSLVTWIANQVQLPAERTSDLVLAVNELATNTINHSHGGGLLRVWRLPGRVICQVEDSGHIPDPLAGRHAPAIDGAGGFGLWTVNQLCDLVEVRTGSAGTTIRVHATLA